MDPYYSARKTKTKTKPIDECEQVNNVNTVNKEVYDKLRNSNSKTDMNQDESVNQPENDGLPSVHGVNDVHVFTDNGDSHTSTGDHDESLNHTKCPYCDHRDHPFFLKLHKRNVHPEQE